MSTLSDRENIEDILRFMLEDPHFKEELGKFILECLNENSLSVPGDQTFTKDKTPQLLKDLSQALQSDTTHTLRRQVLLILGPLTAQEIYTSIYEDISSMRDFYQSNKKGILESALSLLINHLAEFRKQASTAESHRLFPPHKQS